MCICTQMAVNMLCSAAFKWHTENKHSEEAVPVWEMDKIPHFEPPFTLTLFSGGPLLQLLGARGREARLCYQETAGGPDRRAQAVGRIYEEGSTSVVCNQWLQLSPGLPVFHLNPLWFLWCLNGDSQ